MDENNLLQLSGVVKVHHVGRSECIDYGIGVYSKIYLVVKGKVKIYESNDMGDELIKAILAEGEFIMFRNKKRKYYLQLIIR
jgi:CRP-like cAMP-binding protein